MIASYWFGKTTANFTVPNPTLAEQNYIDFTTLKTYSAKSDLSGWTQTGTFVPPVGIDFTILITSKFWDIPEQSGQQGGWAQYNHTDEEWSWWPKIISFENVEITGNSTVVMPQNPSTNQIVNKDYVDNAIGNGTITITQGGITKGTLTTNQATPTTIDLDAVTLDPHRVIAFQAPTAENNYTWYRLYADGWVEQGGVVRKNSIDTNDYTAVFPIAMQNINFTITMAHLDGLYNSYDLLCINRDTTSITLGVFGSAWQGASWQVSGMAAS